MSRRKGVCFAVLIDRHKSVHFFKLSKPYFVDSTFPIITRPRVLICATYC
jgi:hypothetical protein